MSNFCTKCGKLHDKTITCGNLEKLCKIVSNDRVACIRGCGIVHDESRSCEDIEILREYKRKFPVLHDVFGRTVMSVEMDILALRIR